MKRTLKRLFSRFSFVALTIILMFIVFMLVLVGAVYVVDRVILHYYPEAEMYVRWGLTILAWIIVIITVMHAANRDMVPETKIPWILCIVALNVFGVAIYLVFSFMRTTKRQRKRFDAIYEKNRTYAKRAVSKEEAESAMGSWAATSEALYAANAGAVLHGNTKTEYFPSGEKFAESLLSDLLRAEKYIFLEYFIIGKGKLWSWILNVLKQKAQQGVEVRVIYDDVGSMGRVHFHYHKTLQKWGVKCVKFNPFVPVVTNIHNSRDHRKITVIDGKIAYTGGINLADEYVNLERPYGYWKDAAIRLEGEGVKNFIFMFLQLYDLQTKEMEDFSPYFPAQYETLEGEGYVQPYGDGPSPLYGRHLGEDVYINAIMSAKKYVWIATPYLIIDYRLREALVLAARRGVDVRLLMPGIPDKKIAFSLTRSNYLALVRGGVKIYEYTPGFIHAKNFLIDDEVGIVGTINVDYRSFFYQFEDAVFMYRTKALKTLKEDMETSFAVSVPLTMEDAKKNVVWRVICEFAKLFAPLF